MNNSFFKDLFFVFVILGSISFLVVSLKGSCDAVNSRTKQREFCDKSCYDNRERVEINAVEKCYCIDINNTIRKVDLETPTKSGNKPEAE